MTVQCFFFIYKYFFLYFSDDKMSDLETKFFLYFFYIYIISHTSLWSWFYQKYLFLVPNSYFFCVIFYSLYVIYMPWFHIIYKKEKVLSFPILLFYWKLCTPSYIYKNIKNNNLQRDDFDYKLFFDTNRIINFVDIIWNCFQIIK